MIQVTLESGFGHRTIPLLLAESSFSGSAKNWSSLLQLRADMTLEVRADTQEVQCVNSDCSEKYMLTIKTSHCLKHCYELNITVVKEFQLCLVKSSQIFSYSFIYSFHMSLFLHKTTHSSLMMTDTLRGSQNQKVTHSANMYNIC